jgi:hypothetical protein
MARVINITDKIMGRLIITPPANGILHMQREYRLTGDDDLLNEIPLQVLDRNISWADVPANIQAALIEIDAWNSTQIDTDEGLT